jgi:hypothetical protein
MKHWCKFCGGLMVVRNLWRIPGWPIIGCKVCRRVKW